MEEASYAKCVCVIKNGGGAHVSWYVYLQDIRHAVEFIDKPKAVELLSTEMAPITQPSRCVMEAAAGMNLGLKGEVQSWTYNSGMICMDVVL